MHTNLHLTSKALEWDCLCDASQADTGSIERCPCLQTISDLHTGIQRQWPELCGAEPNCGKLRQSGNCLETAKASSLHNSKSGHRLQAYRPDKAETGSSTCAQGLCKLVHRLIAGRYLRGREHSGRGGVWSLDEACYEGARLPAMLLGLDCQKCSSPC